MASSPLRRPLFALGLALGLALYSALFAEAFLRLLAPEPLMPRYVTAAPFGVRANIEGARYRHATPEVSVDYRISAQGLRDDRIFAEAKPPGTCRIALFGDSFFMGYELDLPDTIAARLEARLREAGLAVEVLNFAVSGFGTAEMRRTLDARGLRFDPDLVVFQWHATDPEDNARAALWRLDTDGALVTGQATFLPSIALQDRLMGWWAYRFLNDHSQLYAFLREGAAGAAKQLAVLRLPTASAHAASAPASVPGEAAAARVRNAGERELALSAALLQAVRAELEADRRDFLVVEIPERVSRTSFASTLPRFRPGALDGIATLSPVELFHAAASPDRKLYWERGHGHLTPHAADLVAGLVESRSRTLLAARGCAAMRGPSLALSPPPSP